MKVLRSKHIQFVEKYDKLQNTDEKIWFELQMEPWNKTKRMAFRFWKRLTDSHNLIAFRLAKLTTIHSERRLSEIISQHFNTANQMLFLFIIQITM